MQPTRCKIGTPGEGCAVRRQRSLTGAAKRACAARPSHQPPATSHFPSGLTLIELLIVMSILVLLVTAAIPVLSPSSSERRLREASRGVNTFIAGAQARAVQSGRPFGVMLKKLSQETDDPEDSGVCLEMYYVEQPSPYAGFEDSSRVMICRPNLNGPGVWIYFVTRGETIGDRLPPGWDFDLLPPRVFQPGDRIVIGGVEYELTGASQGAFSDGYFFTSIQRGVRSYYLTAEPVDGDPPAILPAFDNNGNAIITVENLSGGATNRYTVVLKPPTRGEAVAPYWSEPLLYKIHRLPTLTSAPPYQLPEGAAIDLRASGVDNIFFHRAGADEAAAEQGQGNEDLTANRSPVTIMFDPDGSISRAYALVDQPGGDGDNQQDSLLAEPVTSSLYLLIGKRENIPAQVDFAGFAGTDAELQEAKATVNWLDGESRWVGIGGQSGVVSTSPVAFVNPVQVAADNNNEPLIRRHDLEIRLARELAVQRAKEGGR